MNNVFSSIAVAVVAVTALAGRAEAQVDITRPISNVNGQHIYRSLNEPDIAYFLPLALHRVSEARIVKGDSRTTIHFEVGYPETGYPRIAEMIASKGLTGLKPYLFRALTSELREIGGNDVDERFRPRLTVAGDPGNLAGPIRYALSVRNRTSTKGKDLTKALINQLFGVNKGDHVANLYITFDMVDSTGAKNGSTTIPIFVGEYPSFGTPKVTYSQAGALKGVLFNEALSQEPLVLYDEDTGCFQNPPPGAICLKSK